MSRARPIADQWFDVQKNGQKATAEQLELLATVEGVDIDDLLEEVLTQGEVVMRLREAFGQGIPAEVLEKRQKWREKRRLEKKCRLCGKEHDSTKHHFVNRWMLKLLDGYQHKWANRAVCTFPACIDCHRDLHSRSNGPHSIADHLTDEEKEFAESAIMALYEEKPRVFLWIVRGDDSVYETRLLRDWLEGKFKVDEGEE